MKADRITMKIKIQTSSCLFITIPLRLNKSFSQQPPWVEVSLLFHPFRGEVFSRRALALTQLPWAIFLGGGSTIGGLDIFTFIYFFLFFIILFCPISEHTPLVNIR